MKARSFGIIRFANFDGRGQNDFPSRRLVAKSQELFSSIHESRRAGAGNAGCSDASAPRLPNRSVARPLRWNGSQKPPSSEKRWRTKLERTFQMQGIFYRAADVGDLKIS